MPQRSVTLLGKFIESLPTSPFVITSSHLPLESNCDPLGPAIFVLGIDDVSKIGADLDLNVWYLDDACWGFSPNRVLTTLKMMIEELVHKGLSINNSKCELWFLSYLVSYQLTVKLFTDSFSILVPSSPA